MIQPIQGVPYLAQSSAYLESQIVDHQRDARRAGWKMIPSLEVEKIQLRAAVTILAIRAELAKR